jgi:hypothetical protein
MKMRYRVHRFDIDMTKDQRKLEQFLCARAPIW